MTTTSGSTIPDHTMEPAALPLKTETNEAAVPPKLTMKLLYNMLTEVRETNLALAGRVNEMERKLEELTQAASADSEAAAAAEDTAVEQRTTPEVPWMEAHFPEEPSSDPEPAPANALVPYKMESTALGAASPNLYATPDIPTFRFVSRSERHTRSAPSFWERLFRRSVL